MPLQKKLLFFSLSPLFRSSFTILLNRFKGYEVVYSLESSTEIEQCAFLQTIDIAIIDIETEPMQAVSVLKELKQIMPLAKIIVLYSGVNDSLCEDCLLYGADECVSKMVDETEFHEILNNQFL